MIIQDDYNLAVRNSSAQPGARCRVKCQRSELGSYWGQCCWGHNGCQGYVSVGHFVVVISIPYDMQYTLSVSCNTDVLVLGLLSAYHYLPADRHSWRWDSFFIVTLSCQLANGQSLTTQSHMHSIGPPSLANGCVKIGEILCLNLGGCELFYTSLLLQARGDFLYSYG